MRIPILCECVCVFALCSGRLLGPSSTSPCQGALLVSAVTRSAGAVPREVEGHGTQSFSFLKPKAKQTGALQRAKDNGLQLTTARNVFTIRHCVPDLCSETLNTTLPLSRGQGWNAISRIAWYLKPREGGTRGLDLYACFSLSIHLHLTFPPQMMIPETSQRQTDGSIRGYQM